jgi:hypothetical protein
VDQDGAFAIVGTERRLLDVETRSASIRYGQKGKAASMRVTRKA